MKNTLKKIIAMVLITAFMLPLVPVVEVFADEQSPVGTGLNNGNFRLSHNAADNISFNPVYSLTANWNFPPQQLEHHDIITYRLHYRRGSTATSAADPWLPVTVAPTTAGPGGAFTMPFTVNLEPGNLYAFRIDGRHWHPNPLAPAPGQPTNIYTPWAVGQQVLFLSDIRVEAEGRGNEITVTWDNPRLNGQNVFSGYNIYLRRRGPGVSTAPQSIYMNYSYVLFVPMDHPDLLNIAGGRLRFTVDEPSFNISPFERYDIAVMPVVGTTPLRGDFTSPGVNALPFGGTVFPIVYPDSPRGALGHARPYFVGDVFVEFPLTVTDLMDGNIRLQWDNIVQPVSEIRIYQRTGYYSPGIRVVTIRGINTLNNFYILPRPPGHMEYQVVVVMEDGTEVFSNWAPYNPAVIDFLPYRPNIIPVPTYSEDPLSIDFEWRAFTRRPFNEMEESLSIGGVFVDPNVVFDIWITDDFSLFSDPRIEPIVPTVGPNLATVPNRTDPFVYSTRGNNIDLTHFSTLINGEIVVRPLEDNTVYFIRIVARMWHDETLESLPGYGTIYIPPLDGVPAVPVMLTSPPLRVIHSETTHNSITIEWDARWFEIYDIDNRTWHSEAWILNGNLYFEMPADENAEQILPLPGSFITDAAFPNAGLLYLGDIINSVGALAPVRHMSLRPNVEYMVHTAQYSLVAGNNYPGSDIDPFLAYIHRLIGRDVNRPINEWVPLEGAWAGPVATEGTFPTFRHTITTQQNPTGDLVENMPYLIFLRPVLPVGDSSLISYFPAFVSETTHREDRDLIIIPTVPNLEDAGRAPAIYSVEGPNMNVQATDTTVTVRWHGNMNLTYILGHGTLQIHYPEGGYPHIYIDPHDPPEGFRIKTDPHTGIMWFYFTITRLFPETAYYLWIRAVAGENQSAWSNPIVINTREMEAPPVPQGLGIASAESVRTYNEENDVDYVPLDHNSMILEWLVNSNDPGPRASTATVTGGNANFLATDLLPATYMVRFLELLPFTDYYARVRTVATLTRGGAEGSTLVHSYVIQLSLTEDFIDAIEVTLPPLVEITTANAAGIRRRASDWSEVVRIPTGRTGDEFDGDRNPELYPLPQDDFEITYDHATRTLNFRFRSNRIDADGNRDNNVDQRFISRLVNNRIFTYNIDLSTYQNYVIANRVVEIPYSIISAFNERKISLRAKMGDVYITIPPGALMIPEVLALNDLGAATVRIKMDATGTRVPVLPPGSLYSTHPQRLSVQVIAAGRVFELPRFARPITVELMVNSILATPNRSIRGYIAPEAVLVWENAGGIYDAQAGRVTLAANRPASYATIATAAPAVTTATGVAVAAYTNAINTVNSRLTITDIGTVNVNAPINANQFNRIIEAIASNRTSVAMNQPLTPAQHQSLGRSGMLVSGTHVSREAGIASLVRLYEVRTRTAVRNFPTEQTSAHPDIGTATAAHRQALLKAEHLGFFNTANINPSAGLTFGEFFRMLSYIIEDMM